MAGEALGGQGRLLGVVGDESHRAEQAKTVQAPKPALDGLTGEPLKRKAQRGSKQPTKRSSSEIVAGSVM